MQPTFEFQGTPRFKVRRRLGSGGMGIVYEAFDRERSTLVAVKVLKTMRAEALLRFKREFRAAQGIEHPNLVKLGELAADGNRWFFTMDLVDGVDFLSRVCPGHEIPDASTAPADHAAARYDEDVLRSSLAQLVQALMALHAAGMVHRDVKPSNFLITEEGRAVLLDFGLATPTDVEQQSTDAHIVGTANYMAPEQAASKPVSPAADFYAVGVMLFEALTGQLPFSGSTIQIYMDKQCATPPRASAHSASAPQDLDQLCADLLSFDPKARPSGPQILRRLGATEAVAGASSTPSSTRSAAMLGREDELQRLRSAFDACLGGRTVSVVVHGESGIGKTMLIKHFTERIQAEIPDVVSIRGRCYERESIPFRALDGVIDSLARYLGGLDERAAAALVPRGAAILLRMFPVLGGVEALACAPKPARDVKDGIELRRRAFDALRELFQRLVDMRPVILVIDDLQWADADSLMLLGDLLRPPEPPPLLFLASTRSVAILEQVDTERASTERALPGHVEAIELGPLDESIARQLAQRLLNKQQGDARADANAIAAEAHGHPLYIDELVRHANLAGPSAPRPRLDSVIWSRVEMLDEDARLVLELAAVAGTAIGNSALRAASRLDRSAFSQATSLLRAVHLLRGAGRPGGDAVEPFHDRVRETVASRLPEDVARAHHGRLGIALETTGGRPEIILRHLQAAGNFEKAATYAIAAAERATSSLAFDRAARLYETALEVGVFDEERRRELKMALSSVFVFTGRGADAAAAALEAAEGADRVTRLECKTRATYQLLICGHLERGLEVLRDLVDEVGVSMPVSPRGALLSVLWNRLRLRFRGIRWSERSEREIAESDLLLVDVYNAASHGLSMIDNVRGADFQARGLRLALRLGEPNRIARALAMESVYEGSQGGSGFDRAETLVSLIADIARQHDATSLHALHTFTSGALANFRGEFEASSELLDRAAEQFRDETVGEIFWLNNARMFRLFTLRHMGDLATIRSVFDEFLREAARRGDRYLETSLRLYGNVIFLAADDAQGAAANLRDAPWAPPEGRFHLQHWYELEARAEAALYEGNARSAFVELEPRFRALKKSLLTRIKVVRCLSRFVEGRLMVAMASDGERASVAKRADSISRRLEQEKIGYAHVWAEALAAAAARLRGDLDAARTRLQALAKQAKVNDMRFYRAAAHHHLAALIDGDEGAGHEARAGEWTAENDVANPARMFEIAVPGFS